MTKLENNFRLADGEAILVRDAAAQDEGVVVEAKIVSIDENHLSNLDGLHIKARNLELHSVLFGGRLEHLAKVEEALTRMELVRSQDELAADVFRCMDGHAVGIGPGLQLRYPSHPTRCYRFFGICAGGWSGYFDSNRFTSSRFAGRGCCGGSHGSSLGCDVLQLRGLQWVVTYPVENIAIVQCQSGVEWDLPSRLYAKT